MREKRRKKHDELEAERRRSEATEILEDITESDLVALTNAGWDNASGFVQDMQEKLDKYGENLYVSQAQLDWLNNIKAKLEE